MRFQFGNNEVDDDARQLRRDGAARHLSPRAFDLLLTLIRERPRVVSKADLHARLWPDSYVSDASLATLVAEVRAALGERARASTAIRTVHRRGYAFQAEVIEQRGPADAALDAGATHWIVTDDRQYALVPGENLVGRDPRARIWLDAPSVSRRHARIHVEHDRVIVDDLGSKNGTRVGDRRIDGQTLLVDGTAVTFGSVGATFRAWAPDRTRSDGDD